MSEVKKVIRNKLGPIPDSHFENEPTYPAKNVSPMSQEMLAWIKRLKYLVARLLDHGSDKYQPGDIVSGPY